MAVSQVEVNDSSVSVIKLPSEVVNNFVFNNENDFIRWFKHEKMDGQNRSLNILHVVKIVVHHFVFTLTI